MGAVPFGRVSMRRIVTMVAAIGLGACQAEETAAAPAGAGPAGAQASIRTCFEPDEDCIALLVGEIAAAEHEVLVLAHAFTNRRIFAALTEAERRGVAVRVIIDRTREPGEPIAALAAAGAEILVDASVDLQHNKVMIFDRSLLATGSQNFSNSSENNAENLLLIKHRPTVEAYLANWRRRASLSRAFRGGQGG